MKIRIHSQTDLITNSSTTIYTYSESSPKACIEMINAIFESFGVGYKCEDIFNLVLLLEDDYQYKYWLKQKGNVVDGDLDEFIKKVRAGKAEKPAWMLDAEAANEERGGTTLYISAKKPEHNNMADKIYSFLYSTRAEESSN